ncbi:MAG TPA: hypothetical protein VFN26_03940 [Candidatus Acidoferrum sp.]|nr:hypothetical protein [Candidatus Acidoferrum sp.]
MGRLLWGALLILSGLTVYAQESASTHAFDYDQKVPLDIQETGVEHRGAVAIHDIDPARIASIPDLPQPPEPSP